ncbi:MAG: tetratricopeptide (TPR) repeat protein [Pseudohongiellaceae bacterium]|jgi:tetratricopeptide (TPR) repeat protein
MFRFKVILVAVVTVVVPSCVSPSTESELLVAASQSDALNPAAESASDVQSIAAAGSGLAGPGGSAEDISRASAAKAGLDDTVASVLGHPRFQKRFAESYLSQTEIEPRVGANEVSQLQAVMAAISLDAKEDALELLAKHRGPSKSAVFDFTAGNLHFQDENYDEAEDAYNVAIEKHPKFLRAHKNLGLVHVREGEFAESAKAFTAVVQLGGGDATTYGLLGYSYSNTEKHLAAEFAYRMAVLLEPKTLDWQMGLARTFFKLERFGDAASLCATLIAGQPDRADLWLLQANAFIGLQQPMKAAENYELVDELGGSTAESLNMLGDIYVNEGLDDIAVERYIRALEFGANGSASASLDRPLRAARVLTAHGALKETRRLITSIESLRGEQLRPTERVELLRLRARLAVAEGNGSEEILVLKQIVDLDPLDGEALILLGQHAARTEDSEQAIFYYERAASLEDFEADAKVRHAQLLVTKERYAEALPLLRRSLALKPNDHVEEYLAQVERVAQRGG